MNSKITFVHALSLFLRTMMKIAWHPCFAHSLPEGHRFPMEKYELLPQQLLHEGTVAQQQFFEPVEMNHQDILLTHSRDYLQSLEKGTLGKTAQRKTGFPWSKELITREKTIMQGTWMCAQHALSDGVSLNIAGGTHHAYANSGEGFCLLNDFAIAANLLLKHHLAKNILILDLDVHQGNGSAKIFQHQDNVFTFSMHGQNNYPIPKEVSNWDIALADNCTDQEYLSTLEQALNKLFNQNSFDFVFYQCGVDVLQTDKLGKLGLTLQGCKTRDELVFHYIHKNQLPVTCAMGGGYSEKIGDIVEAHANTFRLANHIYC